MTNDLLVAVAGQKMSRLFIPVARVQWNQAEITSSKKTRLACFAPRQCWVQMSTDKEDKHIRPSHVWKHSKVIKSPEQNNAVCEN